MSFSAVARPLIAAGLLAAVTACGAARLAPATSPAGPTAQPAPPVEAVGALFVGGDAVHTCSAAVVNSTRADLILTAAHCLAGGVDATFVPGYDDTGDQHEWTVDAVFLDPRWAERQDPQADFAIARVSRDDGGSLRIEADGGLALGRAPSPGAVVTVTGYPMGVGGGPISCTAATGTASHGFPSLRCGGLTDGLSGSPWLAGATITGLIGGLDGGGCDDNVSYTPVFDSRVTALRERAEAGGDGDEVPAVWGDGCD